MNPQPQPSLPPGPYDIKKVLVQVEIENYDPATGKATGSTSGTIVVYQSDFGLTMDQLILKAGLTPAQYTPSGKPA